jgi:RNA polymerase-interacting CarD/CdnL/TRCF family regulator
MSIRVGDRVHDAEHGVAIVREVRKVEFADGAEVCVIEVLATGVIRSRPAVALVRAEVAIEEVYRVLRSKDPPSAEPWAATRRRYVHRIASGHPLLIAFVLRELAPLVVGKKLCADQRALYQRARTLVVREVATMRGVAEDVVEREIDAIFGT